MLDFEPGATNFSTYWRISGPIGETEPARARPKPSRMDFRPNASTSSGMSWYFVLTMKSQTYFVSPGTFGNLRAPSWAGSLGPADAATIPSEPAKNSRRFMPDFLRRD